LAHTITTVNANPGEKAVCKARLFMAKSRSGKPGTTIYIEQNLGKCLLYEVDPWDPDTLQGTVNYSFKSSAGGNKQKSRLKNLLNFLTIWTLTYFILFF
jgi:hypothetical protein